MARRSPPDNLTPLSLDPVAKSSVECRGGELPATPLIVSWNDSVIDPSRAPRGKHLKKFVVLGVPYEMRGDATGKVGLGHWDEVKDRYAVYLIDMIAADYIPDLKAKLLKLVASSVDPGQLALRFLGEEIVGPEIAGKMGRYEWGDAAFVIYAALDGPVECKAGPEAGAACHVRGRPILH